MKKILLFCLTITACTTTLQAQTLSMFLDTDSAGCNGLTVDEDMLYVVSSFHGKVFRKDITSSAADYETFNIGGSGYHGLCKAGDYIYIAKPANGLPGIYRFNPDNQDIVVENFMSLNNTYGLASRGAELYVSAANKIYKIDLNTSSASLVQIADNISGTSGFNGGTIGLKVYDNFLYVADATGISKINLDSGNYEKELITTYTGSSFAKSDDNIFYLTSGSSVHQLDLATQTYSLLVTIDNFIGTYDISFADNSLFVTTLEGDYDKVARIDLASLNVEKVYNDIPIMFPNPASEYITFTGAAPSGNITIVNQHGQLVRSVKPENAKIDVSGLETGVYFIKINNVYKKFIKN